MISLPTSTDLTETCPWCVPAALTQTTGATEACEMRSLMCFCIDFFVIVRIGQCMYAAEMQVANANAARHVVRMMFSLVGNVVVFCFEMSQE